jgi:hypothetical protein
LLLDVRIAPRKSLVCGIRRHQSGVESRLPQRGLPPFQNQTVLRYTLSASGLP